MARRFLILILLALPGTFSYAQKDTTLTYPNAAQLLPDYPKSGSTQFAADSVEYEAGKALRPTERGQQAVKDADCYTWFERFGIAMGATITKEHFPAMTSLIDWVYNTQVSIQRQAKHTFARHRPYQYFNQPSGNPEKENPADFTSYPSGHAFMSWMLGLTLASIDPEHSTKILQQAYELGQSRIILGFHYRSDIEAGRLMGSVGYSTMLNSIPFMQTVEQAKAELKAYRDRNTPNK